jgi:hypothetical protein
MRTRGQLPDQQPEKLGNYAISITQCVGGWGTEIPSSRAAFLLYQMKPKGCKKQPRLAYWESNNLGKWICGFVTGCSASTVFRSADRSRSPATSNGTALDNCLPAKLHTASDRNINTISARGGTQQIQVHLTDRSVLYGAGIQFHLKHSKIIGVWTIRTRENEHAHIPV